MWRGRTHGFWDKWSLNRNLRQALHFMGFDLMAPRRNESCSCEEWPKMIFSLVGAAELERNAVDAKHRLCKCRLGGFFVLFCFLWVLFVCLLCLFLFNYIYIKPIYIFFELCSWMIYFHLPAPQCCCLMRVTRLTYHYQMAVHR